MDDLTRESILNQFQWIEDGCREKILEERIAKQKELKDKAVRTTLYAVTKCMRVPTKGDYKSRLKGIAQGHIYLCDELGFLTEQEADVLLKIIK